MYNTDSKEGVTGWQYCPFTRKQVLMGGGFCPNCCNGIEEARPIVEGGMITECEGRVRPKVGKTRLFQRDKVEPGVKEVVASSLEYPWAVRKIKVRQ